MLQKNVKNTTVKSEGKTSSSRFMILTTVKSDKRCYLSSRDVDNHCIIDFGIRIRISDGPGIMGS